MCSNSSLCDLRNRTVCYAGHGIRICWWLGRSVSKVIIFLHNILKLYWLYWLTLCQPVQFASALVHLFISKWYQGLGIWDQLGRGLGIDMFVVGATLNSGNFKNDKIVAYILLLL